MVLADSERWSKSTNLVALTELFSPEHRDSILDPNAGPAVEIGLAL